MTDERAALTRPELRALMRRVALIGVSSGLGTGVAFMLLSRVGFGALLGSVGVYVVLAGAGWFTGRALDEAFSRYGLSPTAARERLLLSGGLALAYAASVDPLTALLVEYMLQGVGLVPGLLLGLVAAAAGGLIGYVLKRRFAQARPSWAAAAMGVGLAAVIVVAVNLLAWLGERQYQGGAPTALMLAGVWAIFLVPLLWLPPVTYFCLKPLAKEAQNGL